VQPGDLHQRVESAFNGADVDALVACTNRTHECVTRTVELASSSMPSEPSGPVLFRLAAASP